LDEHGNFQSRPAQRVGDAALLAEIRQGHDDAVDLVTMTVEQIGANARFGARLHRAVLGFLGAGCDDTHAGFLEDRDHLLAAGFCQMVREKAAVPDDEANGDIRTDIHRLSLQALPLAILHASPYRRQSAETTLSGRLTVSGRR